MKLYPKRCKISRKILFLRQNNLTMAEKGKLSQQVKALRKQYGLTQEDLAYKSGVGLRFVRDMEQGKKTLRMDKVNAVLALFGKELGVVEQERGGDEL